MFVHPGKKLLFMGSDIGDYDEWNHHAAIPWQVLQFPLHVGLQACVKELNRLHAGQPALHEVDFEYTGFEWIDFSDVEKSVISFIRRGVKAEDYLVIVCNFTPTPWSRYSVGVPELVYYQEILNTDSEQFGGSNMGNGGGVQAQDVPRHHRPHSISITLPPLSVIAFKPLRPPS
jgi:1,4-alpha-glucan branching enzyme